MSTDLNSSLVLRSDDSAIVAENADISAVLLMAIGADRSYVYGALHPFSGAPVRLGCVVGDSLRVPEGLARGGEQIADDVDTGELAKAVRDSSRRDTVTAGP